MPTHCVRPECRNEQIQLKPVRTRSPPTIRQRRTEFPPDGAGVRKPAHYLHISGLMQCSKIIFSLYRLIGAAEQRERKGDAEHLGGFHVDDQLDLRRPQDR
jgi:hypothetical protein